MQFSALISLIAALAATTTAAPVCPFHSPRIQALLTAQQDNSPKTSDCATSVVASSTVASPTLSSPTGPTSSAPSSTTPASSCKYTCTGSSGAIDALNCVNVLTGVPIVVPITVGKGLVEREENVTPVTYCCKPDTSVLSLISCVDVTSGAALLLPVNLFTWGRSVKGLSVFESGCEIGAGCGWVSRGMMIVLVFSFGRFWKVLQELFGWCCGCLYSKRSFIVLIAIAISSLVLLLPLSPRFGFDSRGKVGSC